MSSTVTASAAVPLHSGMNAEADCVMSSSSRASAIPTRVLATDFVAENTSRGWSSGPGHA
jgi:hypothetical protein